MAGAGMEAMKENMKRSERKPREKKRKSEQRGNDKHLAKVIAQIEKRLTKLENLVDTSLLREEPEAPQELSTPTHDTVDNAQADQEEEYPGLKLKQEWKGREINLDIEAKRPYPNYQAWYKITGYYTRIDAQVQFSKYPYDFFRFRDSAAIEIGENHDKIVDLLYKAGIITKQETWRSIGVSTKCVCYRLTDQALEYAHRKR